MIRPYESMLVYDGNLPDDAVRKEQQNIEQFFKDNGAEMEAAKDWGRRDLAYPIKKRQAGVYSLYLYKAEADLPEKLERVLKLNTKVIRHLTVLRDLNKRTWEQVEVERIAAEEKQRQEEAAKAEGGEEKKAPAATTSTEEPAPASETEKPEQPEGEE